MAAMVERKKRIQPKEKVVYSSKGRISNDLPMGGEGERKGRREKKKTKTTSSTLAVVCAANVLKEVLAQQRQQWDPIWK